MSTNRSSLAGLPHTCTTQIAFVRAVIRLSTSSGSAVSVRSSMSQKMGTPPRCRTGAADAKKVYGGTITSSPGFTPIAKKALCNVAVPLFINSAYRDCVRAGEPTLEAIDGAAAGRHRVDAAADVPAERRHVSQSHRPPAFTVCLGHRGRAAVDRQSSGAQLGTSTGRRASRPS